MQTFLTSGCPCGALRADNWPGHGMAYLPTCACTAAAHAGPAAHARLPDTAAFLASLQRLAASDGTAALSPEQQAARDAFRWVWAWVQVLQLPMYASTNGLCEAKGVFLVTTVRHTDRRCCGWCAATSGVGNCRHLEQAKGAVAAEGGGKERGEFEAETEGIRACCLL